MSKYIDTEYKYFPTKYTHNDTDYAKGWNACLTSISQQPIVDVSEKEPTKEGTWKLANAYEMFGGDEACWSAHGNPVVSIFCSECGFEPYAGDVVAIPDEAAEQICNYRYCPGCGAKMKIYADGEYDEMEDYDPTPYVMINEVF